MENQYFEFWKTCVLELADARDAEEALMESDDVYAQERAYAHYWETMHRVMCKRERARKRWGFGVPSTELIQFLATEAGNVLEVGAGNGYIASCVLAAGGNIVPTDIKAEDYPGLFPEGEFTTVLDAPADEAARAFGAESDTLFCSWPYYTPERDAALQAILADAGYYKYVVLQGEMPGMGVTGTEEFITAMHDRYYWYNRELSKQFPSTNWPMVWDSVHVWEMR